MLKKWESIVEHVDLAFQPIIDIHTGKTVAVESLLRNYQEAGFCSIDAFFDTAYHEEALYGVDLLLRKKALDIIALDDVTKEETVL
jgi:EAL domain-containing protein (putative c-di-GMP-specific phosphodiesterase class I)